MYNNKLTYKVTKYLNLFFENSLNTKIEKSALGELFEKTFDEQLQMRIKQHDIQHIRIFRLGLKECIALGRLNRLTEATSKINLFFKEFILSRKESQTNLIGISFYLGCKAYLEYKMKRYDIALLELENAKRVNDQLIDYYSFHLFRLQNFQIAHNRIRIFNTIKDNKSGIDLAFDNLMYLWNISDKLINEFRLPKELILVMYSQISVELADLYFGAKRIDITNKLILADQEIFPELEIIQLYFQTSNIYDSKEFLNHSKRILFKANCFGNSKLLWYYQVFKILDRYREKLSEDIYYDFKSKLHSRSFVKNNPKFLSKNINKYSIP